MNLNLQIYIDTSGSPLNATPTYERLDLFDFEMVELTSTIQDVRDISKIFTDYTQEFSIPASKNNNRIFKHFYNNSIIGGFDARIKQRASIRLNGIEFRNGLLRLSEGTLTNDRIESYKITFFGKIVSLKDILGDDSIKDLTSLGAYNHEYTLNKVYDGFNVGLALDINGDMVKSTDRDVVYPSISYADKWYYDSSETPSNPTEYKQGFQRNLYVNDTLGNFGIDFLELKPALRVKKIIEAIESKYASITFSDDFFSDVSFNELYMLLHNKKGLLADENTGLTEERIYSISLAPQGDFVKTSGDSGLIPIETTSYEAAGFGRNLTTTCNVTVRINPTTVSGDGNYVIEALDSNNNVKATGSFSGIDEQSLTFTLSSISTHIWDIRIVISSDGGLATFNLNVDLESVEEFVDEDQFGYPFINTNIYQAYYVTKDGSESMLRDVNIPSQLPDIKVIDFLKGLFNMFNLTAYVEDGVIVIKTLYKFYNSGKTIDLTKEVDKTSTTISRGKIFSNISFEFSEPKTFGVINQNEVQQEDFGNLEFQSTENGKNGNLVFDGEKYSIKLPFEKAFYERLSNQGDLTDLTPFSNGWLVDKDQSPTITKPILFFNIPTTIDTSIHTFGFKNINAYIPQYNRASNVSDGGVLSIHFGEQSDEFTGLSIKNSLFEIYYKGYISNIFNPNTRIITYDMLLKLGTLLKYELNDEIVVRGKVHRINSIKTNINNGKSTLELISDFSLGDTELPSVPTNLAVTSEQLTIISISWTASTDNVGVIGYEIWLDGLLHKTIGSFTSYDISGLTNNTDYDIQVLAFDDAGNKSALSAIVVGSTLQTDNQSPVWGVSPQLSTVDVRSTTIEVQWTPATDNIAVTGYEIWVNQDFWTNVGVNASPYIIEGLTPQTSYDINMYAFDAVGNKSVSSNTLNEFTLT
jgi:hypothetical protein